MVEAMRDFLFMRIFGFFRMRHPIATPFAGCQIFRKITATDSHFHRLYPLNSFFIILIIVYSSEIVKQLKICLLIFYLSRIACICSSVISVSTVFTHPYLYQQIVFNYLKSYHQSNIKETSCSDISSSSAICFVV